MPRSPLKDVVSHWSKFVTDFETSPREFYASVEHVLAERKVPALKKKRIIWNEGGVLSPRREYLRLSDGRISYDVCAAPFGTGFFFSWWLTQKPVSWVFLYGLAFLLVAHLVRRGLGYAIWGIKLLTPKWGFWQSWYFAPWEWLDSHFPSAFLDLTRFPRSVNGLVLWLATTLIVFWAVAMVARLGRRTPEAAMLRIPVFGPAYARLFAPDTYYTLDTALMLRSAVHGAVTAVVDSMMAKKGLRALTEDERKPILRGFL